MKKLAAILSIALLLAASNARAVTRWSYNSTTFKPIRVVSETITPRSGWQTRSIVYSYDECGNLVVTVTNYFFGIQFGDPVVTVFGECP